MYLYMLIKKTCYQFQHINTPKYLVLFKNNRPSNTGKWFIHGLNHHKGNQLQTWNTLAEHPNWEY